MNIQHDMTYGCTRKFGEDYSDEELFFAGLINVCAANFLSRTVVKIIVCLLVDLFKAQTSRLVSGVV